MSARLVALDEFGTWVQKNQQCTETCWSTHGTYFCSWSRENRYLPARNCTVWKLAPLPQQWQTFDGVGAASWLTDDMFAAIQQCKLVITDVVAHTTVQICSCALYNSEHIASAHVGINVYRLAHSQYFTTCVSEVSHNIVRSFTLPYNRVAIESMAWSPNGSYLAVYDKKSIISVYGNFNFIAKKHDLLLQIPHVPCFAWSPDSTRIVVGNELFSNELKVYTIASQTQRVLSGHERFPNALFWLRDQSVLCAYGNTDILHLKKDTFDTCKGLAVSPSYKTTFSLHPNETTLLICRGEGAWLFYFTKWTDRTHYTFHVSFRRLVFVLMCVKERLFQQPKQKQTLPVLPMHIWLLIVEHLVELPLHPSFLKTVTAKASAITQLLQTLWSYLM